MEAVQDRLVKSSVQMAKSLNGSYNAFVKGIRVSKEARKALQDQIREETLYQKKLQETERTQQQKIRTEQENIKLKKQLQTLQDKADKLLERERKNAEKLTNEYEQLKKQYADASNESLRLGAALFKQANGNEELFAQLVKTDKAYQDSVKNAQRYNQALDQIEINIGKAQRRVGQYERAQFSLQQVLREFPSLAISPQTFFLAISNNIPMLADDFKKLASSVDESTGKALGARGAFKQLAQSVFSPQTAILAVVSALTLFGDKIFDAIGRLFTGKKSFEEITREIYRFNEAVEQSKQRVEDLNSEISFLKQLADINLQIRFDDKTGAILGLQADAVTTRELLGSLRKEEELLLKNSSDAFSFLLKNGSERVRNLVAEFEQVKKIPADLISELSKADQALVQGSLNADQALGDIRKNIEQEDRNLRIINARRLLEGKQQNEEAAKDAADKAKEAADKLKEELEKRRRAIYEYQKLVIESDAAFFRDRSAEEVSDYTIRLKATKAYYDKLFQLAELEREFELNNTEATLEERRVSEQQYLNRIEELVRDATNARNKILEDEYGEQARIRKEEEDKKYNELKERQKAEIELRKELQKSIEDIEKKTYDRLKKEIEDKKRDIKQLTTELSGEIKNALSSVLSSTFEREKNQIQEQIDLINERRQADIEATTASITNQQERAAKIAEINARADAEEKRLEREKRKRDIEQAKIEKALNIAKIIQSTSVAVIGFLAKGNVPAAVLAGAIGAAQLAAAIATVIPAYKHGTQADGHPGGLAVVGDGGRSEMAVTPDGRIYKTDSNPQLVNLPRGTMVYPDFEKEAKRRTANYLNQAQPVAVFETMPIEQGLEKLGNKIVKAIKNNSAKGAQDQGTLSNRFIQQTNGQQSWLRQNRL
ncbi:MAG: hypothetical protein B7Z54_01495 [Sphingobacteriales bacterium 12-47-4]|nr:MAG: hypothetical protein B7Z54_01495 [Sphingobacteriales bacterium 12-47-4]